MYKHQQDQQDSLCTTGAMLDSLLFLCLTSLDHVLSVRLCRTARRSQVFKYSGFNLCTYSNPLISNFTSKIKWFWGMLQPRFHMNDCTDSSRPHAIGICAKVSLGSSKDMVLSIGFTNLQPSTQVHVVKFHRGGHWPWVSLIPLASEIIPSSQTLLIVSNVCSQGSLPHSDKAEDFSHWPRCWSLSDSTKGLKNRCQGFHTLAPRELSPKDIERCWRWVCCLADNNWASTCLSEV